jgi:hypothetical protein
VRIVDVITVGSEWHSLESLRLLATVEVGRLSGTLDPTTDVSVTVEGRTATLTVHTAEATASAEEDNGALAHFARVLLERASRDDEVAPSHDD